MKIKRACLKKFWITAVGCFFLAMFVLTDLLNKAETRDLPIGHTYTDRQTVQTKGLASHVGLVDASSAVKVCHIIILQYIWLHLTIIIYDSKPSILLKCRIPSS